MWFPNRSYTNVGNFRFRKKRNSIIRVAKTKALISFVVTAMLISRFVFAYAECCFSRDAAQLCTFTCMNKQ